jgi:hypothetical protein
MQFRLVWNEHSHHQLRCNVKLWLSLSIKNSFRGGVYGAKAPYCTTHNHNWPIIKDSFGLLKLLNFYGND